LPGQKGHHCPAPYVKADPLEEAVWQAVAETLQQPELLAEEYRRRLAQAKAPDNLQAQQKQMSSSLKRIKTQEDRLIDAYRNEVIELDQLKVEMGKLKAHKQEIEHKQKALDQQSREQASLEKGLSQLEDFCEQVSQGLDSLTFEEKQKLLRLVVDHITLEGDKVCIHAVIPTGSSGNSVNLRPYGVH
jgi:uncharacterized protein